MSAPVMAGVGPDTGSALEQGIVRLVSLEGQTLGTGFAIGPQTILTCHHVVNGVGELDVHAAGATTCRGTPAVSTALAAFDLALVSCAGPLGGLLPIAAESKPPMTYESRGFHHGAVGFTDALPLRGTVVGTTSLTYGSYAINAWALSGMSFGPGMSGAPIVDADTGVVVGVISTRLQGIDGAITGTGVPLDLAASLVPELATVLRENSELVPRFGRHLNASGARVLLRDLAARIVRSFVTRGIYLPNCVVARPGLDTLLEQFIAGDRTVLPVIGMAGSGKTTFVARLAASMERAVIVVPALTIRNPDDSIEVLCGRAIDQIGLTPARRPTFDALLRVIGNSESPPVVIVEGLNEAGISPGDMRDLWLPSAAAFARDAGVKLVVTCRPEYWAELNEPLDRSLLHESDDAVLGEFSDDELTQAVSRYGIAATDTRLTEVFRLPLMLRMLSELGPSAGDTDDLRRTQAIDRFVDRRANAVANRIPNRPPTSVVRMALERLAKELFRGGSLSLDRTTYDTVTQPPAELGWALFKENLLFESGSSVRFTFDEIAEFLIAQAVGLNALDAAAIRSLDESTRPLSSSVVTQLLRRGYDTGDPNVARIVSELALASNLDAIAAPIAVRAFLLGVPDATPFLPAIRTLVERSSGPAAGNDLLRRWTFDILGEAALPWHAALELARAMAPAEDGYDLRDKDRTSQPGRVPSDKLGTTIGRIVARGGVPALDELATWLTDETRLAEGEASVGSVAAIVLGSTRQDWGETTVQAVAAAENNRARELIALAYRDRPAELAGLCDSWIADGSRHPDFILSCVDLVAAQGADRGIPLYRRLLSRTDDDSALKTAINERLLGHRAASDDQIQQLIEALATGTGSVLSIQSLLITQWDEVERALLRRLEAKGRDGFDPGGIVALGQQILPPAIEARLAVLIRELYETGKLDAYATAQMLESKLNRIDPGLAESAGFVDLALTVARDANLSARRCLAYVAFPTTPDPRRQSIEARLRDALMSSARDSGAIVAILKIARDQPREVLFPVFDALMPRLTAEQRDTQAFSLLMTTHAESEALVSWVAAHAADLGAESDRFLRRLRGGQDPRSALQGAIHEFLGG